MKFTELNLNEQLMKGIEDAAFTECLPVQEQTYAHTFQGRDVMVQSQTGSGKTAAFLVSIFQLFADESNTRQKRALIIAPTRELAVQIEDEAKILGAHLPYRTGCFYGGVGYDRQERLLEKGVDIVIGTPGRLIDYLQSNRLRFDDMGVVVIDEADRLFDMGFLPDLRRMLKKLPDASLRQTMLFSATLSTRVQELAWEYMNDPVAVNIEPEHITVETVTQVLYHVEQSEKMSLLLGIMQNEKPGTALIFTNMKTTAVRVAKRLNHNGHGCEYIIGDLPQSKRLKIINEMKAGNIRILVATDVAARGLHINDLDLVVNYDLPEDPEAYVHRIGRTARAGKKGKAITMACERYVYSLEAIEALINMKLPVRWASDEDFSADASAGMHFEKEKGRRDMEKRRERSGKSGGRGREARSAGKSSQKKAPASHKTDRPAVNAVPAKNERTKEARRGGERKKREAGQSGHRRTAERAGGKQPAAGHQAGKKQQGKAAEPRPPITDRLEYYRKKYGDDFGKTPEQKKTRGGKILSAIRGIFSRKKKAKK